MRYINYAIVSLGEDVDDLEVNTSQMASFFVKLTDHHLFTNKLTGA